MDINQTSLPFSQTLHEGRCCQSIGNTMGNFLRERCTGHKPGYCSTKKKAGNWCERKQISSECWDPNPVEFLGCQWLFGHLTLYWDPEEWTDSPVPMWSLDSTSAPGCLHSVGMATQQLSVPFGVFLVFFFNVLQDLPLPGIENTISILL